MGGRYTGLIDLGEIRGNNRLLDLATCAIFDSSSDRTAYSYVLEGYREMVPLTDNDLYAIELMALFRTLPAIGKKAERPRIAAHFFNLAKKQLDRISKIYS